MTKGQLQDEARDPSRMDDESQDRTVLTGQEGLGQLQDEEYKESADGLQQFNGLMQGAP